MLEEARERARRTWTIDDHSQLQPGRPMRELYDLVCRAFAKLELDQPEPLRKYISFKAGGTNVVDIIPLHDRLRCHLNSKKEQLSDPHRMLVALLRSKHPGSGDVYAEINTSRPDTRSCRTGPAGAGQAAGAIRSAGFFRERFLMSGRAWWAQAVSQAVASSMSSKKKAGRLSC